MLLQELIAIDACRSRIYKITKKYDKKCGRATMKTTLHFVETMDFTKRESLEVSEWCGDLDLVSCLVARTSRKPWSG